jgi:hypothetical protein
MGPLIGSLRDPCQAEDLIKIFLQAGGQFRAVGDRRGVDVYANARAPGGGDKRDVQTCAGRRSKGVKALDARPGQVGLEGCTWHVRHTEVVTL